MGGIRQTIEKRHRIRLSYEQVNELSAKFLSLQSPEDLSKLVEISPSAFIALLTDQFTEFTIPKKNKGKRLITRPSSHILDVQRRLNYYLQSVYIQTLPSSVFGNIPRVLGFENRSALENAKTHINKEFILNVDIKDFFQSINTEKVRKAFTQPPFNFKEPLSSLICKIVTHQGILPTGAATSSIISNFSLLKLDLELENLALKHNGTFTRYIDDLTFSFNEKPSSDFLKKLILLLDEEEFRISWHKFQLRGKNQKQEVNGITVNEYANISTTFYKELRATFHNLSYNAFEEEIDKYIEKNITAFRRSINRYWGKYFSNRGHEIELSDLAFLELYKDYRARIWFTLKSLEGKLSYVSHILGFQHPRYLKLLNQYEYAVGSKGYLKKHPTPTQGLEIAFITNSTSDSVVYYAYNFLKKAGYNNEEINQLRDKFTLDGTLSKKEIQKSLIGQSAHLLNLYQYVNDYSENKNTLSPLINKGQINKNVEELLENYSKGFHNRKVFHSSPDCGLIKKDYEENVYFKNTGVFAKAVPMQAITKDFLIKLSMRPCKGCC